MKPSSPPEPLYTFTYPKLGYSIQIVPHAPADRAKIKRDAKSRHVSLRDYCQDEIIGSMVLAEFEWRGLPQRRADVPDQLANAEIFSDSHFDLGCHTDTVPSPREGIG